MGKGIGRKDSERLIRIYSHDKRTEAFASVRFFVAKIRLAFELNSLKG